MEESSRSAPEDRISHLPDEILHQILSSGSLSTRDLLLVARLSKRWRHLWKSSPFLDLEDAHYLCIKDDEEAYSRFVDNVLLLRDKFDVYSFRLFLCLDMHPDGQQHLYNWAQYAVRRNAKVIELDFHTHKKNVDLPPCIFACQSVEELRFLFDTLYGPTLPTITLAKPAKLGGLKKLHLKHVDVDGDAMHNLLSGCPVVEELVLDRCWLGTMIIKSPTLRVLIVERCAIRGIGLLISCCRLVSFRFAWNFVGGLLLQFWELFSLVSATVLGDEECTLQHVPGFESCIGRLANAETIKMINPRLEFISERQLSALPPFSNLKNLTLGGWRMSDKFLVIAHIIRNSPNLQMLTLTNEEKQDGNVAESREDSHENGGEPSQDCSHEDEGESSQNHRGETEAEHSQKHRDKQRDEVPPSQKHTLKQLWFHCPHTVITCRVQCGDENERLLDMVSNAIVSKYTLPDHKVRIIPCDMTQARGSC